ncbi:hypothetical protein Tco_0093870 [Tanacetum coccineum]
MALNSTLKASNGIRICPLGSLVIVVVVAVVIGVIVAVVVGVIVIVVVVVVVVCSCIGLAPSYDLLSPFPAA